jgi:MraZ protein
VRSARAILGINGAERVWARSAMSLLVNTALFLSTHTHRIDGKGRVSFPAPFRTAVDSRNSQGLVIFRSLVDPAIEGMTVERLQQMASALESFPPFAPERAYFETAIFGAAQALLYDGEGRCSLPKSLLDQVGITTEVAFLGRGATFQIWEPQALERRRIESIEAIKLGTVPFPVLPAGVL